MLHTNYKQHRSWSYLGIVAGCLTLLGGSIAHAQNDFELSDENFNQWLYSGNNIQPDFWSEIVNAVEAVDLTCGLSDAQKLKLRLAARGDFARFDERVEDLRSEVVGKKYDQNEVGQVYQRVQKLTLAYQAGLLGEVSLFSKVLMRTLDSEQQQKFEQARRKREEVRYAAKVRMGVALLEQSCPMTGEQRTALVDLLMSETRPPKRFSEYDWYVVLLQAAKIPDERYSLLFDAAQIRVLKRWFQQGAAMEHFLKEQGVVPDF